MACWEEHFWTDLLASLPEMVRISSLLPTETAGDKVRERWEWRVSTPLDREGERARPRWAGGFTPEWGHSLAPHPGPSCPLQPQTQRCCCLKPCWRHVAWPWQCSMAGQAFTECHGSPDSREILYLVVDIGKKMSWTELTYLLPFYSTAITFSTTRTSLKIKEIEN